MEIFKATIEDIKQLISLRFDYFAMEKCSLSKSEEKDMEAQLQKYFTKHLPIGDFIAILAKMDGKIVSTAFMVLTEKPANPIFITGITGTLLNVMTYPEYRRKGISTMVITEIITEAKKMGASSIDLFATEDGKPLYEKMGFIVPKCTAMRLQL